MTFSEDDKSFYTEVHRRLGLVSIDPRIVTLSIELLVKSPGTPEDISKRIRGEEGWKWFLERAAAKS